MPETHRLYLDQMLRLEVAQALRDDGHDVLRASEVGQARADDFQILQKSIAEKRILITFWNVGSGRGNRPKLHRLPLIKGPISGL